MEKYSRGKVSEVCPRTKKVEETRSSTRRVTINAQPSNQCRFITPGKKPDGNERNERNERNDFRTTRRSASSEYPPSAVYQGVSGAFQSNDYPSIAPCVYGPPPPPAPSYRKGASPAASKSGWAVAVFLTIGLFIGGTAFVMMTLVQPNLASKHAAIQPLQEPPPPPIMDLDPDPTPSPPSPIALTTTPNASPLPLGVNALEKKSVVTTDSKTGNKNDNDKTKPRESRRNKLPSSRGSVNALPSNPYDPVAAAPPPPANPPGPPPISFGNPFDK